MRVVIAEDSALLRQGIVLLLTEADIEVAAAVGDSEALLRAVEEHRPDVCVTDVRMPPDFVDEGLRAALAIRAQWPGIGVLVLSQYVEERYASELIGDQSGGVGYLLKDRVDDVDDFVAALERVAAGETVLDPEVVKQFLTRGNRTNPLSELTAREREVLGLMAEGQSNAGIADALTVSHSAVGKHINNIFMKLALPPADGGGHRRVQAVLRYLGA